MKRARAVTLRPANRPDPRLVAATLAPWIAARLKQPMPQAHEKPQSGRPRTAAPGPHRHLVAEVEPGV